MERRRIARLSCAFPFTIVKIGSARAERQEVTRNISANGGICFHSTSPVPVGEPVHYEILVSKMHPPVRLSCAGRVVRCQPAPHAVRDGEFEIAITMERYTFAHSDAQVIREAVQTRPASADPRPVLVTHRIGAIPPA